MEKSTAGIVIFLVGIFVFLQSFAQQIPATRNTYAVIGLILVVGGLRYATKK